MYPIYRLRAVAPLLLGLGLILPASFSQAQTVELSGKRTAISPNFLYDAVNRRADEPGVSRLDVYIKIANDELVFVKDKDGRFHARYEISLVIMDRDDFQMDGKIWKEEIVVDDFDATNSRQQYHLSSASFNLPPDKYKLSIGLTDLEAGRTNFQKGEVELVDFGRNGLAISDILFADYVEPDSTGTLVLRPKVTNEKTRRAERFAYFEIYDASQPSTYDVRYEIKTKKGDRIVRDRMQVAPAGDRTGTFLRIDTQKMVHGSYLLKLKVSDGKTTVEEERPFLIRWEGVPPTVADLDLAIEQMRYIAEKGQLKKLKRLDKEEKLKGFLAFWKVHDPTPGTRANELLEEYYRRVNYAEENFGTYTDGWKTDRGMVYITFGPPDDVERQPFPEQYETDSQVPFDPFGGRAIKAKEFWIYHDRNLVLEFIDVTGYGEFKLRYPQLFYEYVR